LVLASSLVFASSHQGVMLRRTLIPRDVTKYKMETSLKTTVTMPDGSESPQGNAQVTGDYTVTMGDKIRDGKLPIEIKSSNLHLTSDAEGGSKSQPDVTVNGLLDERNTITEFKFASSDPKTKAMGSAMGSMMGGISAFPEKAVQPGDTWDIVVPMTALGGKDIQLTMRYDGVRTEDGKTYWVVHVDQDVPMTIDLGAMSQAEGQPSGPPMTMKGTMHITMEALYDQSGRTHSVLSESKSDMGVDGPSGGNVRVQSDQIMKLTEK
jgi:hypothetical protein